ncbi:hypothetical protein DYB37_003443 [Aphanomyces astaci]|uniref:Transmembrane protein n=2 Tax=Aphanomyces astaci TaxID=112090 RepID=A0A3R6XTN4_APHAT|nr:hypothetical protein DYB35_004469 [Aphanomyces astaci]RHZ04372.1 hypothetical protein DYB37_003443 [Aphanomyces astaci]
MLRWFFLSNAAVAVAVAADPSWPPTGQCSVPGYTSWTSQCPSLTTSVMPIVVTKRDVGGFGNVNMSALDTLDEARAVLQGTSAVNAMKGMRSESVEYYNSSLANMMITFCYVTSTADELDRCVPPTSPHAQRNKGNASNTCLVVPGDGSCAAKNLCERLPNCLWPTADPTKMHDLLDVLTEVIGNLNINSKNLLAPLHAIQDLQGITTAQVQSVLADTSWVTAGALQLQSIGDNFDLTYTNAFPKTCIQNGDVCLTCPATICGGSSVTPQATLTEWRVVADQLESTFQMTRDAVYSGSVTLFSAANDAEDMLTSVASATSDSGATVASVQMTFDSISYTRSGLVLSIFILGLFVAFLGMAGFVKGICKEKTKWVHLLHASWGLGVVLCIISFVVASCLIAVSAVWFDGCQYLDMVMNDMTPYFSAETSRVVGACIKGTSTLAALGMATVHAKSCEIAERYRVAQQGGDKSVLELARAYAQRLERFVTTTLTPVATLNVWTQVNALQCTSAPGCGWINEEYAMVHNILCQDLLGACLNIALSVFMNALFLLPMAVCGIVLQKRLRAIRGGTYGAMEPPTAGGGGGGELTGRQKLEKKLEALTKGQTTL